MRHRWQRGALMLAVATSVVGAVQAQTRAPAQTPAPRMLQQYNCYICHADNDAKTGPAFADIAAAYKGDAKAVDVLATVVRKGSHGSGPWRMPPHPEISEADAKAMVRHILSLQK